MIISGMIQVRTEMDLGNLSNVSSIKDALQYPDKIYSVPGGIVSLYSVDTEIGGGNITFFVPYNQRKINLYSVLEGGPNVVCKDPHKTLDYYFYHISS